MFSSYSVIKTIIEIIFILCFLCEKKYSCDRSRYRYVWFDIFLVSLLSSNTTLRLKYRYLVGASRSDPKYLNIKWISFGYLNMKWIQPESLQNEVIKPEKLELEYELNQAWIILIENTLVLSYLNMSCIRPGITGIWRE